MKEVMEQVIAQTLEILSNPTTEVDHRQILETLLTGYTAKNDDSLALLIEMLIQANPNLSREDRMAMITLAYQKIVLMAGNIETYLLVLNAFKSDLSEADLAQCIKD